MEILSIIVKVLMLVVLLIILYYILKGAIRNGIDESKIGKYLMEKHGIKDEEAPIQKEIEKTIEENKHRY